MSGRERGRLVEEEELRELAGSEQRPALPAAELEPAGDPAPPVVTAPNPARGVVEAAAIAVDEPARRVCNELAERCHAVLERHCRARLAVGTLFVATTAKGSP